MIDPQPSDVGRKVVFTQRYNPTAAKREEGVITSINEQFVFVRYGNQSHSKATYRSDLEWLK